MLLSACKSTHFSCNKRIKFPFFYLRVWEKSRTFALVIELERHIEILLLSNDCVIVPDLGGFMAHHVDARYDVSDGMFVPPLRTLGFNPQLKMNDSLLVQSYIEAYDISYPEALRRIESEVAELRSHLEKDGQYELNDIGLLRLNGEGNLEFEPCEAGILTPELYGLSAVSMAMLETKKADDQKDGSKAMPEEGAITIKMSWLRNAVAVAAAVIAFLMIGTPVSNSDMTSDVKQSAFIHVGTSADASRHHRPAAQKADEPSPVASEEADLKAVEELVTPDEISPASAPSFGIVMASQVTERNAKAFIDQLTASGYAQARIVVSGPKQIRRVIYGSYASEAEAVDSMQQLRRESRLFKDTWILEIKP